MKQAFKVLNRDLANVGLLGAPKMRYRLNRWNRPMEPLSRHPRKGGGLWVAPSLSAARQYKKYLLRKHGIRARIFKCRIGKILHETSSRIKTDKLFFTKEDEIE